MKTTKKKSTKYTCVQCHREFKYKVGLNNSVVSICNFSDCPNYGLLAMPQEQMPKEEKI